MTEQDDPATLAVSVENLGGIRSCQISLDRGVTILTGRNATNRTSLLRAIGAGLGGSTGELRTDADAGVVTLSFDGEAHARTFEREGGTVRVGGDPYTEDATLVDQYSSLLADNPARAAVERADGDALREYIMAPVDTAAIRATVDRKQERIRSVRDELETARREADRVPDLERRLEERRADLDEVRSELETLREAVEAAEADADDAAEAEAVVEDLAEAREERDRVRDRLDTQRTALESLRAEREEVAAELADTSAPEDERARLEDDLERLQRRERDLETQVNSLLSIVEFNEQLLDDGGVPAVTTGEGDPDTATATGEDDATAGTGEGTAGTGEGTAGDATVGEGGADDAATGDPESTASDATDDDVTGELVPETRTVECWTCGTPVERGAIDDRLDDLRALVDDLRRERNELRTEIDERRSELREIRSAVEERQTLEAKLDDVDAEIDERESRIDRLEEREAELAERVEELEAEAAASDDLRDSDLLERYRRLSELEYERGQLEESVDSLASDLETARERAERVAALEADLETHREDLAAARDRIERLEREAVETFNEHMETVLDLLDYGNVERVWIERTGNESAAADDVAGGSFALHVVRSTDDGAVFEDTVDHLSESEREVIGLVVALAGYLVHDVHEAVPVVALDSLEAIDADRIAALVEYVADFVPFLVVALLPEDAAALPETYDRIRMGEVPA